jgi:hypothetical protein
MKTLTLHAMLGDALPSPLPVAVLTDELIGELALASGRRIIASNGRIRVALWIRSRSESPQKSLDRVEPNKTIWLSRRAVDLLHLKTSPTIVKVEVDDVHSLRVQPALVDDLPPTTNVDLGPAELPRFRKWAIGYGPSNALPVRVRRRSVPPGAVRMSMLTRTLAGLADDSHQNFLLAPLLPERLAWIDDIRGRTTLGGLAGLVVAALYRLLRCFLWIAEHILRLVFHAPELPMRTTEAKLGDDTNRVVRIAKEAFSVLGIKPGDEVFVQWANRRVIAIAHEEFDTAPAGTRAATVDTWGKDQTIASIARHLVIGIAAEMRGELRIPRRTVVTVRRRVTTLFVQRLNELTVPVGGLLLAALTIQGLSRPFVAIGIVVVTLLAMLPARYRVPPRGRWP